MFKWGQISWFQLLNFPFFFFYVKSDCLPRMGVNENEDLLLAVTCAQQIYTGVAALRFHWAALPCCYCENLHVCVIRVAPKVISAQIRLEGALRDEGKIQRPLGIKRNMFSYFLTGNSGPHFRATFMKNSKLYQALKWQIGWFCLLLEIWSTICLSGSFIISSGLCGIKARDHQIKFHVYSTASIFPIANERVSEGLAYLSLAAM